MRRPSSDFWRGKRVFLTGHTGFKGGWMALKLNSLGASVFGYALAPGAGHSFFELCGVKDVVNGRFADIRDAAALTRALADARPDVVIHMAAQSLVREGYADPVGTFEVNLMGTVRVLEAVRGLAVPPLILAVTTDKVYENAETGRAFVEGNALGGRDPYAASKACAELAVKAYFHSFFETRDGRMATARAGNVLGGGDWAKDRLLPDILSAFAERRPALLRSPHAVRPWQHVLDPLEGYLLAVEFLAAARGPTCTSWNFGPPAGSHLTVRAIAERAALGWGEGASLEAAASEDGPPESHLLSLDPSRARLDLGWSGRLDGAAAVQWTVDWMQAFQRGGDMRRISLDQIMAHENLAGAA